MRQFIFVFSIIVFMPQMCSALDRFDIVTTEDLVMMLEKRKQNELDFLLINTLDEILARNKSIPGSISVPWSRFNATSSKLGTDKEKLIVTYCMGYRWVYAYKVAVAIKELGFTNIRIYNGGLKDWVKSNLPLESKEPIPAHKTKYIETDALAELLHHESQHECRDSSGNPSLIILDLRNELVQRKTAGDSTDNVNTEHFPVIDTSCPVVFKLFDDFLAESVRNEIPVTIPVITITETGNRDDQVQAYFSKYGYNNILSLKFGMRGWIKGLHPVKQIEGQ